MNYLQQLSLTDQSVKQLNYTTFYCAITQRKVSFEPDIQQNQRMITRVLTNRLLWNSRSINSYCSRFTAVSRQRMSSAPVSASPSSPSLSGVRVIDMRSDTLTKPTESVRRAMYEGTIEDDVYREEPTIKQLENKMAAMWGKGEGRTSCYNVVVVLVSTFLLPFSTIGYKEGKRIRKARNGNENCHITVICIYVYTVIIINIIHLDEVVLATQHHVQ